MNLNELKLALEKAKRQLAVVKEADEKAFAEKKIAKLESQIMEAEKTPESKDEKPAKAKKEKKAKVKKEKKTSSPVVKKAESEVKDEPTGTIDGHKYKKVSATEYLVEHNKDSKKVAAIVLKGDKWDIQCCDIKKFPAFHKEEGMKAVKWIISFWECMETMEQKHAQVKASRERAKKRSAAGKPAELTVKEVAAKAMESMEKKAEKEKPTISDVKSVAKTSGQSIVTIAKEAGIDKGKIKKIKTHNSAIEKILSGGKAKKMEGGGNVYSVEESLIQDHDFEPSEAKEMVEVEKEYIAELRSKGLTDIRKIADKVADKVAIETYEKGGKIKNKIWVVNYITTDHKNGKREIELGRQSEVRDVQEAIKRMYESDIEEVVSIKEKK